MFENNYVETIKSLKGFAQLNYLNDTVLKNLTFPHQLSEFIQRLLYKTTKEGNWQVALKVCMETNDIGVWETLTNNLKTLSDKNTKPSWLPKLIKDYVNNVRGDDYQLKGIHLVLTRNGMHSSYLKIIYPKFSEEANWRAMSTTAMSQNTIEYYAREISDWEFVKTMIYGGKMSPIQTEIIVSISLKKAEDNSLKHFSDLEFRIFLEKYPEIFEKTYTVNSACAAHRTYRSDETTTLLVNIIMGYEYFSKDSQLSWLFGIYNQKGAETNIVLNKYLYNMTKKEQYLSDEIKDIFLF